MKRVILIGFLIFLIGSMTGCSAFDARLAAGTAVASGEDIDASTSDEDSNEPTEIVIAAASPTNTLNAAQISTAIQQTVEAIQTLTPEDSSPADEAATNTPTVESTATLDNAKFTALAQTLTQIANSSLTPTPEPATSTPETTPEVGDTDGDSSPSATPDPCNAFRFLADVTYPDGASVNPSTSFYKSWQVKNTGSCTWSGAYSLVYASGFQLGGTSPLTLGSGTAVVSGQNVTLTIQLFTPPQPGTYTSSWLLQDGDGHKFGGGPNGDQPLTVNIVVPGVQSPVFTSPASTAPPFFTPTP